MSRGFYVTIKRAEKTGWLLGPFAEHEQAKSAVHEVSLKASDLDPWAWFDAFGTSSFESEALPPGILNKMLPHLLPNYFRLDLDSGVDS